MIRASAYASNSLLPFASISRGTASGIAAPLEIVVESQNAWRDLWRKHAPPGSPLPSVDFSGEVVIGIFAGQRPTAGFQVRIVRVERGRAEVRIEYEVQGPPRDAFVAQVLTQPFHLIRVPRLGLPVRFERR